MFFFFLSFFLSNKTILNVTGAAELWCATQCGRQASDYNADMFKHSHCWLSFFFFVCVYVFVPLIGSTYSVLSTMPSDSESSSSLSSLGESNPHYIHVKGAFPKKINKNKLMLKGCEVTTLTWEDTFFQVLTPLWPHTYRFLDDLAYLWGRWAVIQMCFVAANTDFPGLFGWWYIKEFWHFLENKGQSLPAFLLWRKKRIKRKQRKNKRKHLKLCFRPCVLYLFHCFNSPRSVDFYYQTSAELGEELRLETSKTCRTGRLYDQNGKCLT